MWVYRQTLCMSVWVHSQTRGRRRGRGHDRLVLDRQLYLRHRCSMWDANPVFRCARIEGQYEYCSEIPMCVCATLRPRPPERRAPCLMGPSPEHRGLESSEQGVSAVPASSAREWRSPRSRWWRNPAVIGQQSGGEGRVGRSVSAPARPGGRGSPLRGPSDQLLRGWTGRVGGCLKSTGNHPRAPGQPWASFS